LLNASDMRWAVAVFLLGCSSSPSSSPSDSTADGGDSAVVTAPGCVVSGTAPFGVHLAASTTSGDKPLNAALDVYFPQGRAPYKPVIFVYPTYRGGPLVLRRELDSSGSAAFEVRDSYCGNGIGGVLVGPNGGITATATVNDSAPMSDALALRSAPVTMCPSGDVPAQKATPPAATFLYSIAFSTTRPVRENNVIRGSNGSAFHLAGEGTHVVLIPTTPPPAGFTPFEEFTVDLSPIVDVLGEPLGITVQPKHLAPTATITDREFTAAPPPGAFVGTPPTMSDGTLKLGEAGPWLTVAALGGSTATKLRIRHRAICPMYGSPPMVAILGVDGSLVPVPAKCGDMVDESIALGGARGPYALMASAEPTGPAPCMYPSYSNAAGYEIDSYGFE
jgi:hypothetical protein